MGGNRTRRIGPAKRWWKIRDMRTRKEVMLRKVKGVMVDEGRMLLYWLTGVKAMALIMVGSAPFVALLVVCP